MGFLETLQQGLSALKTFNEFRAMLDQIGPTVEYVENERLMLIIKGFKSSCPGIYSELEHSAHLEPEEAINRIDALYPGAAAIRTIDNYPRIVRAIQTVILANERRDQCNQQSGNSLLLPSSLQRSKRQSKTRRARRD